MQPDALQRSAVPSHWLHSAPLVRLAAFDQRDGIADVPTTTHASDCAAGAAWLNRPRCSARAGRGHSRGGVERFAYVRVSSPCSDFASSARDTSSPTSAPASCASTKPGTSSGRMPAKVRVIERASVTAGLAKDVLAVNQ